MKNFRVTIVTDGREHISIIRAETYSFDDLDRRELEFTFDLEGVTHRAATIYLTNKHTVHVQVLT